MPEPGRDHSHTWAFVDAVVIIVGQTWLARSLGMRPVWLMPAVSALLLVGSVAVYWSRLTEPDRLRRWFALSVVAVLSLANAVCLGVLVVRVFQSLAIRPFELLAAGVVLWVVNVAVFALAYWEVDGRGPERRAKDDSWCPDLVFPQQQAEMGGLSTDAENSARAAYIRNWKPQFSDYLYVSVTAATAFSPTDAMPFTRRAKLIMGSESTISIAILVMIVARAINIADG